MGVLHRHICLVLASLALAACEGEQVHLLSHAGELSYDCAASSVQAKTPAQHALVREYAINAVRDARNHGRLPAADTIISAYDVSDTIRLERAVIHYMCRFGDVREAAKPVFPEPGSRAREVSVRDPETGDVLHLSDYRGRIVILSFWSHWCGPCRKEIPDLGRVAERYRDRGVVVLPVLKGDDPEAARAWLSERKIELPILSDADGVAARTYQVRGIPRMYVIGPDGSVLMDRVGYRGPEKLESRIQMVLASEGQRDRTATN